jgi:hypothetical protein
MQAKGILVDGGVAIISWCKIHMPRALSRRAGDAMRTSFSGSSMPSQGIGRQARVPAGMRERPLFVCGGPCLSASTTPPFSFKLFVSKEHSFDLASS